MIALLKWLLPRLPLRFRKLVPHYRRMEAIAREWCEMKVHARDPHDPRTLGEERIDYCVYAFGNPDSPYRTAVKAGGGAPKMFQLLSEDPEMARLFQDRYPNNRPSEIGAQILIICSNAHVDPSEMMSLLTREEAGWVSAGHVQYKPPAVGALATDLQLDSLGRIAFDYFAGMKLVTSGPFTVDGIEVDRRDRVHLQCRFMTQEREVTYKMVLSPAHADGGRDVLFVDRVTQMVPR